MDFEVFFLHLTLRLLHFFLISKEDIPEKAPYMSHFEPFRSLQTFLI